MMSRKYSTPVWAVVLAISGFSAYAEDIDQDMIELGRSMVTFYCQDCHAIGADDDSTYPPAPPFRTLHTRYDVELLDEALVEGLVTAHPAMPEFEFEPVQAEGIIAYLKSLETSAEE